MPQVQGSPSQSWAPPALPKGRHLFTLVFPFGFIFQTPEEEEILNKKRSKKIQKKYDERKKNAKIANILEEQFQQGKLLGESLAASTWV